MKISIGSHVVKGPWGGGNLFVINLSNYLIKKGHTVIYDLIDDDIDLILLTDPRGKILHHHLLITMILKLIKSM